MSTKRKTAAPTPGTTKKTKTGGPPQFVAKLKPEAAAAAASASPSKRQANETHKYDYARTGPVQWQLDITTGKKAWCVVGAPFTVQNKGTGDQVPVTGEVLMEAIGAKNNASTGTKTISFSQGGQQLSQIVPENPLFFTNTLYKVLKGYSNGETGVKLSVVPVRRRKEDEPGEERFVVDTEAQENAENMLLAGPELVWLYWRKSRTDDKPWYDEKKNKNKLHSTLAKEWKPLVKAYTLGWDLMIESGWSKSLDDTTFKEFIWHKANLVPKTIDVRETEHSVRVFARTGEDGKLEPVKNADGTNAVYDQGMEFDEHPENAEYHSTTNLFKQRFSPGKSLYLITQTSHYYDGNNYTPNIPMSEPGRMNFVGQAYKAVGNERHLKALTVDALGNGENQQHVLHEGDVIEIKKVRASVLGIMKGKADAKPSPAVKTYKGDTLKVVYRSNNTYPLDLRSWEERQNAESAGAGSVGAATTYDQFAADDEKWAE